MFIRSSSFIAFTFTGDITDLSQSANGKGGAAAIEHDRI